MLNLTSLALSLFGTFAVLIISYLAGVLLQKGANAITKSNTDLHSFWKLFSGLFFLLGVYAIIITHGVTILFPIPFLIFLFNLHQVGIHPLRITENVKEDKIRDLKLFIACILFHVAFFGLGFYSFHANTIKYTSGDFNIYLRIAEYLNRTGIENNSLDPIYASNSSAVPYHYGDIWLYALVSKFTGINSSGVLLISLSTLSTLIVYGIKTYIFEKFRSQLNSKYLYLYFLVCCGLFSGFSIFFPTFLFHSDVYVYSVLNYPKVLLPTLIFISLVILARTDDWVSLVIVGIIGGLSFINVLPVIYMSVALLLFFNLFKRNISLSKALALEGFLIFFTAGFCWLLYKVISTNKNITSLQVSNEHVAFNVKTCINIFVSGTFQLFTILPYLIVLIAGVLVVYKKNIWEQIKSAGSDILLLALLFFCALACWAILYPLTSDSVQFFSNGLLATYVIVIPLILIWIVAVLRNKVLTIITLVFIFAAVVINRKYSYSIDEFDRTEWREMTSFFKEDTSTPAFVNLHSAAFFTNTFSINTNAFIPLNILNYRWPAYYNLSLNAPYIKGDSTSAYYTTEKELIEAAPFTKYVRENVAHKSNKEYLVTTFLKKFHIKYITVAKDTVLPIYLRPAIQDSLILKSAGWTIYRLTNL